MFSYYGSKAKVVQYYPSPTTLKIREAFAGSARYSVMYWDTPDILLMDKYQVIVDVWHYLQRASQQDILGLSRIKIDERISEVYSKDSIEYKFLGFLTQAGQGKPADKFSSYRNNEMLQKQLKKIASNLYKIKHWKIIQGSYEDLENEDATWFIDPPYEKMGVHQYQYNSKTIDFNSLANWCKSRLGQVIVCENLDATWLNFKPLINFRGSINNNTEAIWTNFPTQYDSVQQELFSWAGGK